MVPPTRSRVHSQPHKMRMEKEQRYMTEKILNLTLEIIYLLTGENYGPLKKINDNTTSHISRGWNGNPSLITESQLSSLIPEKNKDSKILEVTQKIIEVLTGEVPIRCQDVTVYFSMEEWEYIEGHKDLYKDVMMENRPPLTSPDGSSNGNSPERCTRPLYSRDSTQKHQEIPEDHQNEHPIHVKVEITEEMKEKYSQTDVQCKEEDFPTDGSSNGNLPERCFAHSLYSRDSTQEDQEIPQDDEEDGMIVVKVEDLNNDEAYGRCDDQPVEEEVSAYITTDGRYSGIKSPMIFQSHKTEGEIMTSPPGLHCGVLSSGPLTFSSSLYKTLPYAGVSQPREPFSHQRTPAGELSHSWLEGEEAFSQKSLEDHSLEAEVKPYSCSVCGKSFRVKSVLIRHEKVHTGEKPYECSQCGKCFAQKSDLAEHERIHTGEKPYPCPECGKCFAKKTNLARHLRMHSGVKPYACSVCGKAFTQKAALDEHVRIHTGEKPYACSHCTKCFAQKSAFAEHQRVHTGERPYACAECGKCFTQGSALAKHQRIHQNQKPRPCPQCGKLFPSEFLLALHERVHQANYQ